MKQYHLNRIQISGPDYIINEIYWRLGLQSLDSDYAPLSADQSGYLPMPQTVLDSDELKFRQHWRHAHWGFRRSLVLTSVYETLAEYPDKIAKITATVITEGYVGGLQALVEAISATHPRVHISYSYCELGKPIFMFDELCFVEGRWAFAHGLSTDPTKAPAVLHDTWVSTPVTMVETLFGIQERAHRYSERKAYMEDLVERAARVSKIVSSAARSMWKKAIGGING